MVKKMGRISLKQYSDVVRKALGEEAIKSADFYSYVTVLCQQATYEPDKTFDGFKIEFSQGEPENIVFCDGFEMTDLYFLAG